MSLPLYLESLEASGRSPAYIRKQDRVISSLLGNPEEALEALALRATQTTVGDALNRLKCYGRWLEESGLENAYASLRAPSAERPSKSRATFTAAEVRKLVSHSPCRLIPEGRRALWHLLSHTGLRPIEASRVKPSHVITEGDRYILRLPAPMQKARRADPIELTAEEAAMIRKHCPLVEGAVDKLYRHLRRDLMAARIPLTRGGAYKTPYDLRRFFVTELIRKGADAETVRQLARHRDIETTLRHYAKYQEAEVGATRLRLLSHLTN